MPCLRTPSVLILAACAAGCGDAEESSDRTAGAADPVSAELGGAEIYLANCAMCHGADGDGNGTVVLDRPARSFRDGGFSFGNTPQAVVRTVANGIGGTPMPGFSATLSEDALRAVADYVIELGPEQVEVDARSMVLVVGARAEVVRGGLPPLADGLGVLPRGLLLGNADGTTFEFDAENLRLLAVRQGEFVRRRDWEGRGGDLLEPLGRVVWLNEEGDPGAPARLDAATPLLARLAWTEIDGAQAEVGAHLLDPAGAVRAAWSERGAATALDELPGFRRSIRITDGAPGGELLLRVAPLVDLVRLGAERVLTGSAAGGLVVVESTASLVEADGALHVALELDASGSASCTVVYVPVASREDAEALRQEGF